jgi:carbonic anhydrase
MTCPNSDSPINISTTANVLSCEVFCSYMHQYKDSACTATYFPDHIKLSYDATTSAAVTFNNEGYNVREVNLYAPSVHTYNGNSADAEMLIIHDGAGKKLIVSIPLVQSNATGASAKILDDIIAKFSSTVDKTKTNDSQLMNVQNYNMENFIPNSPYYFYMGGAPFSPCDGQYSFVVFDKTKSPVTIGSDTLKTLTALIQPSGIKAVSRSDYYYNSSGPNAKPGLNGNKDEIYIECNPTGEDGEILYQTPPPSMAPDTSALSMDNLMHNPYLNVVIGVGLSYMALKIVGKILS